MPVLEEGPSGPPPGAPNSVSRPAAGRQPLRSRSWGVAGVLHSQAGTSYPPVLPRDLVRSADIYSISIRRPTTLRRRLQELDPAPASSVTWALAPGRPLWASCGYDPTGRLRATYPWAEYRASSVTWALAPGRPLWASCGYDPTGRLRATYPWAEYPLVCGRPPWASCGRDPTSRLETTGLA